MTPDERAEIRALLESHNTLTLATQGESGVWAATVFFAADTDLNLYFVSDRRTRHARDLASDPRCSATINADVGEWLDVRGLQLRGSAAAVTGLGRANALRLYLARFSDVRRLFDNPRDDNEATIGDRLRNADFYQLTPDWIRLIDNRKWFGYKLEVDVSSASD